VIGGSKKAIYLIFFIILLDLVGFGIIIPILPFYVRSFGVSDIAIGLLAASYSLTQFVSAPFLGSLSDSWGRRPILMISLLGSSIAWFFFGIAEEIASFNIVFGLVVLFSARMFAGAMGGNISAANAYIADVTTEEDRAKYLGLMGAAFAVGFIIGPALGGFLATDYIIGIVSSFLPSMIPITPYSLPSFVAALLSLSGMVLCAIYLPETNRDRGVKRNKNNLEHILEPLKNESIRGIVIVALLGAIAFSGVTVMFVPFVADIYGYSPAVAGLLLTYVGIISAITHGSIAPKSIEKYSPKDVAIFSSFGIILSMFLMPFCPAIGNSYFIRGVSPYLLGVIGLDEIILLLVVGIFAISIACHMVSLTTLISLAASEDQQGSAFGVFQSAGSLGRTFGPPIMALLYIIAIWSPFVVGSLIFIPVILALRKIRFGMGSNISS
jgi:DHA1 family tetracycline resistance protein-like MFS transporter